MRPLRNSSTTENPKGAFSFCPLCSQNYKFCTTWGKSDKEFAAKAVIFQTHFPEQLETF
jgi:hypothetical protein